MPGPSGAKTRREPTGWQGRHESAVGILRAEVDKLPFEVEFALAAVFGAGRCR